jgi:hypothetical protein
MATLYVAEFPRADSEVRSHAQVAPCPPIKEDTVAIGVSSAQSEVFSEETRLIRVHADAICSIAFGANPTATSANMRLAAGQTEYFAVDPGARLAVISNS